MSWHNNIFTPERKKGGATHWLFVAHCWQGLGLGGVEWVGKAWVWTSTWSTLLDFGGHGGATTTGPDATYPPAICQNSGGGGGGGGGGQSGGGVWPGVGGGSYQGSGGGSCRGSGGGLAGGQGGVGWGEGGD